MNRRAIGIAEVVISILAATQIGADVLPDYKSLGRPLITQRIPLDRGDRSELEINLYDRNTEDGFGWDFATYSLICQGRTSVIGVYNPATQNLFVYNLKGEHTSTIPNVEGVMDSQTITRITPDCPK